MPKTISIVRGMQDILPKEQKYWSYLEKIVNKRLLSFGFQRITTPIIENKELYLRGVGSTSDIVTKELFGVVRLGTRDNQSLINVNDIENVLRPEGTAGIVRAYVDHGMHTWPQPVKLYSLVQNFRYDRPQKGRYRQHTQVNVEVLGDATPLTDAMTLLALWQILQDVQLSNKLVIELNSIGDKNCCKKITEKLRKYFKSILPYLCLNCQERYETNPLRLLDCKEKECQKYRQSAPPIIDSLCADCREHFMLVLEYLDAAGVPYDLNPYLVRGLDYYTRTVFEIRDKKDTERQSSIVSGGRYDELVKTLGGKSTPAFGFGIGMERLIDKLQESKINIPDEAGTEILIIQLGKRAKKQAIPLLVDLAKKGQAVSMALGKESLKSQLKSANKMGAKLALIIGEREALDGTIICRNMVDSSQETVDAEDIVSVIEKKLAEIEEKE